MGIQDLELTLGTVTASLLADATITASGWVVGVEGIADIAVREPDLGAGIGIVAQRVRFIAAHAPVVAAGGLTEGQAVNLNHQGITTAYRVAKVPEVIVTLGQIVVDLKR